MNPLQQYQFWIGLGFAATLVVFLMIAFFKAKNMTRGQWLMSKSKILSSVSGAIVGILISGEALLNFSRQVPGGRLTVSGTAGFAVFFVIWFFFPKEPASPLAGLREVSRAVVSENSSLSASALLQVDVF